MESINVAVLGPDKALAEGFCRKNGKGGTSEDITFFSHAANGRITTLLCASAYPAKLTAAAFAAAQSDYVMLVFDAIGADAGELILLLDALGKKNGCILSPIPPQQLTPLLKGTALEGYAFAGSDEKAAELIAGFKPVRGEGVMRAVADHCFDVKGVGVVVLGLVECGKLKVHDRPWLMPHGRLVEVRSLQEHDVDMKEVSAGSRFGASMKGVEAKEVGRGALLCSEKDAVKAVQELKAEFIVSKFLKEDVAAGSSLHLIAGMQAVPCKAADALSPGGRKAAKVTLEAPIATYAGERIVLADLNRRPRIVANATMA